MRGAVNGERLAGAAGWTGPAGLRRVRLADRTGLGEMVLVQVHINVYPGQWRQLTIGPQTIRPGKYPAPPVVNERGVEVNTAARRSRRMAILGLLVFLLPVAAFVATCLLGPHMDRL